MPTLNLLQRVWSSNVVLQRFPLVRGSVFMDPKGKSVDVKGNLPGGFLYIIVF